MTYNLKFSLVTTCWNERNNAQIWLSSIKDQIKIPDEVIIVDSFSTDGTFEIIKEFIENEPTLNILLIQEKCNVAKGRNIAIKNAKYDYIVSTDLGLKIPSNWFLEITKPFYNTEIDIVVGEHKYEKKSLTNVWAKCEYILRNGGQHKLDASFIPSNRNIAYAKYIWEQLNGYPEDLTLAADDTVFGIQINNSNYKIAYAPKAIVYWTMHGSLKPFLKQNYIYGIGNGETDFDKSFIRRLYILNLPFKTVLFALINLINYLRIILSMLKVKEYSVFFASPLYIYKCSLYYSRGYFIGMKTGHVKCKEARNRINCNSCI